ncbi:MAG: hypothetical protein HY319_15180 [Armatimonadetes bacterium]|nr:hypothetical protein [Armatimonadota bacterium]
MRPTTVSLPAGNRPAAAVSARQPELRQALEESGQPFLQFALETSRDPALTAATREEIARTALENHEYGAVDLSQVLREMLVNVRGERQRAAVARRAFSFLAARCDGASLDAVELGRRLEPELRSAADVQRVLGSLLELAPSHDRADNAKLAYHIVFRLKHAKERIRLVGRVLEWLAEHPPRPDLPAALSVALRTVARRPEGTESVLFAALEKCQELEAGEDASDAISWAILRNLAGKPEAPQLARALLLSLQETSPSPALERALSGWKPEDVWMVEARAGLKGLKAEKEAALAEQAARREVLELRSGLQPSAGEISKDRPGYVNVGGVEVPIRTGSG